MRQVKKCCRPTPMLFTTNIQKTYKDFRKALEITTRGKTARTKPKLTTTTKNKDRGINDQNLQTDLQKGGTTTTSKFQQETIPILKKDIQSLREKKSKTI